MRTIGPLIALLVSSGAAWAQPGAEPPATEAASVPTQALQGEPAPPDPSQAPPPATPQAPPPGSTRATFLSTTSMGWDITFDDHLVCSTPCSVWIPPLHFVALHSHEVNPVRLDLGYMPAGTVMVRAKPLATGEYAAGITFTTLSSMGLVTGITLTAVGCSTHDSTMCTGGLITGIGSAVGLYGSILLMRHALPRAQIGPATPYVAGTQVGLAGKF